MEIEKDIIDFYKKYSDQEIKGMLNDGIVQYNKIVQSERIAKTYLEKYGVHFYYQNEKFKKDFARLLAYSKYRHLIFKEENYYTECSIDDVIERIQENKCADIDALREFSFEYIGYLGNNAWNSHADIDDESGLAIKINEINLLYERIINEIKENCTKKNKTKTK